MADLGSGSGDFLKAAGGNGVAVDRDVDACTVSAAHGGTAYCMDAITFLEGSLPRRSSTAIFSRNLLEHLRPDEVLRLLDLAAKRLPVHGRIVLVTANPACLGVMAGAFWDDPEHVRPYTLAFLCRELEARGFTVMASGADEDSRPKGFLRSLVRGLRTRLVGDYFGPPEIYVMAEKREAP